jgi:hypothetical protein
MAALNTKIGVPREVTAGENPTIGQLRANTGSFDYTVRPGALLIMRNDGSSFLEPPLSTNPQADAVVMGYADIPGKCQIAGTDNDDADGGALDVNDVAIFLRACAGNIGYFDTGATVNEITADHANRGLPCFAYDTNTLYLTSNGGTLPFAGLIGDVTSRGVQLINTAAIRAMAPLFIEGGSAALGVTASSSMVRAVVTSLAANTEAAGVITADANGAIGAQDGITLVAGDEVWILEGTTNLDAAADAGKYTVTQVGTAGLPFILTRPADWKHGAVISQASDVKVAEGTLYGGCTIRTFAAKGAVVGTDAPAGYPDYVAQQVTLVAGTSTISNVPIKSASKVVMTPTLIGGTPAATTTNYEKKLASGVTAGVLGTAAIIIEAQSVAGTIVNTDVAVLNVGIRNW